MAHYINIGPNEGILDNGVGQQAVPLQLRNLTAAKRADMEEGLARHLKEQSILRIRPRFSLWAKAQLEQCIKASDPRKPCSNQPTFRLGVRARTAKNLAPNFLSIWALEAMFFGHQYPVKHQLEGTQWEWMLQEVEWHPGGYHIRNPADPTCPWYALDIPDMPDRSRPRPVEKYRRNRPIYRVTIDGDITVQQPSILPTEQKAYQEEMLACDDRLELVADGNGNWIVQYEGPLRPEKRRAAPMAQDHMHQPGDIVNEDGQVIHNNVGGLGDLPNPVEGVDQLGQAHAQLAVRQPEIRRMGAVRYAFTSAVANIVQDLGAVIWRHLPTLFVMVAMLVATNPHKASEFLRTAWDVVTWPFSKLMEWYHPKPAGILGNLRRILF